VGGLSSQTLVTGLGLGLSLGSVTYWFGGCVLQGPGGGSQEQSKTESTEEGREAETEEGGSSEAVCQGRRFIGREDCQITSVDALSCADSCFMVTECISVGDTWRGIEL